MTYLDHAATTPMRSEVVDVMTEVMQKVVGNPSSIHQYGRQAHQYLETARQTIADNLHAHSNEITFNSGGTEGDNTVLIQTALDRQKFGKHIITTAIEHPAILRTAAYLETLGFEVTYLPVDRHGQLSVESVASALRPDTILVSVMFANNETGNLLPIQEIGALLNKHQAYFHTDAVQAYGKVPLDVQKLPVDFLTISGHKINGPKGIGFMYKRQGISLSSMLHGGEQEEKRRAGTENLLAICGLAKAIELLPVDVQKIHQTEYQALADDLLQRLDQADIDYQLNGDKTSKLPHILNLRFVGVPSDRLLMHLDLKGFAVSTGSACTAGNIEPSHVLEAMYGKDAPTIHESLRISFGLGNTLGDTKALAEVLIQAIQRLKR